MESGDRILIGIRRMWHRSTARNMPLIIAGRNLDTPDQRSAAGQLYGIITTAGNAQKPQDRRRSDRSNPVQARILMRRRQDTNVYSCAGFWMPAKTKDLRPQDSARLSVLRGVHAMAKRRATIPLVNGPSIMIEKPLSCTARCGPNSAAVQSLARASCCHLRTSGEALHIVIRQNGHRHALAATSLARRFNWPS